VTLIEKLSSTPRHTADIDSKEEFCYIAVRIWTHSMHSSGCYWWGKIITTWWV